MGDRLDNARSLYLDAIRDGNYVEAIETYAGARYTQHSTPVKDGKEGFKEFFADFAARNPIRDIQVIRGFEDGQYVFLHVLQDLNNGEFQYVTADVFDTDEGAKLIEHWDIIAELGSVNASGRTQLDGPTEPTDLDKTGANKGIVGRFVDEVLVAGSFDRAAEFVHRDLQQHGPRFGDGIGAFQAFAADVSLRCIEVYKIVGCGNFVAVLAEIELDGTRSAVIDLYRVDEALIVEHWEVSETITPKETWVNSGKF